MKIALAQLNYHIGNFASNEEKIIASIHKAKQEHADLIIFAELAIGGYPAKDLLSNAIFINQCEQSLENIAKHCTTIDCIIGAPTRNMKQQGKALFNSAVVLSQGLIKDAIHKSLLPDYDVFDEYRYFEPNDSYRCIEIKGNKIALTICEDLWDNDFDNSYKGDLIMELNKQNPDIIINLAASPFSYTHYSKRLEVLTGNINKVKAPLLYVNQVGAHTDIIFDGRSLAFNKEGKIVAELASFQEDLQYVELQQKELSAQAPLAENKLSEIALIHQALICGLRDYFTKSGFKKAVLGLSGGLDSAVVASLAVEALGAENVLAVLMPSVYSSDHSIDDALALVNNTGCHHLILPIKDIAQSFENTLSSAFEGLAPDLTEENIQARTRGTLLMAVSNKFGHILLNTSNKSEAAVGYGTLYGDMAGSLSVIGDVYKTQAYQLAKYINREQTIIPINTIVKPPSAELRPDQKDSDSLPDYEILDAILYQLVEKGKAASEIISLGFEASVVQRISKLLNNAEFKRYQAPPTLRVSPKAFGPGRAMPLVAKNNF